MMKGKHFTSHILTGGGWTDDGQRSYHGNPQGVADRRNSLDGRCHSTQSGILMDRRKRF